MTNGILSLTDIPPHPRCPLDEVVAIYGMEDIRPPDYGQGVAEPLQQTVEIIRADLAEDVLYQGQLPLEQQLHVLAAGGCVGHRVSLCG